MPTDKERTNVLLELAEELFIQGCAMRALLQESGLANWHGRLDKTINSEQATPLRAQFREIYEQYLSLADQNAQREFLKQVKILGKIQ